MAVVTITKENFENEVLKSDKPEKVEKAGPAGFLGNVVRSLPHGFADRGRDRKRA